MKLKKVVAWGLTLAMAFSLDVPGVSAASSGKATDDTSLTVPTKEEQIAIAKGDDDTPGQLPGTTRTFFDEDSDIRDWFNISGFVAENVQDRSEYYREYVANGKKNTRNYYVVKEDGYFKNGTGEYITVDEYEELDGAAKASYTFSSAEEQFVDALGKEARVIQVNAEELELGFHYLQEDLKLSLSHIAPVTDYEKGSAPQTNPIIMHKDDVEGENQDMEGTGVSDVELYSHLTMFSPTGCLIRHAGLDLGGCEDIIIRNFRMEGMYEWDDYYAEKDDPNFTTRKRYGWCNVSLNESNNIWVDHCTFGFAFDGNLDIKSGSSVTVTWCKFGVQDMETDGEEDWDVEALPTWNESNGCELWKNILYMEECYQNWVDGGRKGAKFHEYAKYRDAGATPKELFYYAAMHSKVHLCGSGEKDLYTNVDEKIVLGFNYYTNVIQRIPMLRSGNSLMYNCIVDNKKFQENSAELVANNVPIGYKSYNTVNNARNGATIGTDTCIFNDVTPCCGAEKQGDDTANLSEDWVGIVSNMVNHNLVVNSKVMIDGDEYTGSSWDNNGENLFNKKGKWTWDDKSSIGDFKWAKWEGLERFRNQGKLDTNAIASNMIRYVTELQDESALYSNFYVGQYELEFAYQCFELEKVETMLDEYGGARKDLYGEDGTELDYIQPFNDSTMKETYQKKVMINLDGGSTTAKKGNTYYIKAGESITLPTAAAIECDTEGYTFAGWKKGSYNAEGKLELSGVLADPKEPVTISAGDDAGDDLTEEYYYATWKIKTYTITFDSTGGSEVNYELTVVHGQTLKQAGGLPPNPTKDGATFLGWFTYFPESESYGSKMRDAMLIKADTCLCAKWNNTVTFETNGGNAIDPVMVESKAKVSVENPTKDGVEFAGWFKDQECTIPFNIEEDTITDPITLYAKWGNTVTFETNGGSPIEPVIVGVGEKVSVENPTKDEMEFAGWFKDQECTIPFNMEEDTITAAITLYAKWSTPTATGSTITFETNGGSAIAPMTVETGEKINELPVPTKSGAKFAGWFKDQECTIPFKLEEDTITASITLYAKWDSEGTDGVLLGDVNGDKSINSQDALAVLRYEVEITQTGFIEAAADVNKDGSIDSQDALAILRHEVEIIHSFEEVQNKK